MYAPKPSRPTVWSATEYAVTLAVQILTMRLVFLDLGSQALGVWSVTLSVLQASRLFDPNVGAGSIRLLASALALGDRQRIESLVAAVFLGSIPVYVLLVSLMAVTEYFLLPLVSPGMAHSAVRELVPIAALSFLTQMTAGSYGCVLTGLGRSIWKSQLAIAGILLQLVLAEFLITSHGIAGLGIAQAANYVAQMLGAAVVLRLGERIPVRSLLGSGSRELGEIVSGGTRLQTTSLAWAGYEMTIRLCMARWGGLAETGIFEAAYKLGTQGRILSGYLAQPKVPVFARLFADRGAFLGEYEALQRRNTRFAFLLLFGMAMIAPLASRILMGAIQPDFCVFLGVIGLASAAHVFAMPSEIAATSAGRYGCNIKGTLVTFAVMAVLGPALGSLAGAYGIVAALGMASLSGATLIWRCNSERLDLPRWQSKQQGHAFQSQS